MKFLMKCLKLFSERQKELRGEVPDVYQYETIPRELRHQVIHIWNGAFGEVEHHDDTAEAYEFIHKNLSYHYGEPHLGRQHDSDFQSVHNFFLQTKETEKAIDVIELSFQYMDQHYSRISPDELIAQLNYWFRRRGVGYQYESGQIIRVDSEFIHSEVVKPALSMLSNPMYKGANDEFLKAHEHYRNGRHKECMNECLKAFESCIKSICDARGWNHGNQNGIRLIKIVLNKGLIPPFMESHFTALRKALEDGALTPRNQRSGHGQGSKIIPVPESMAGYALHLTASNILLLAKADEDMK